MKTQTQSEADLIIGEWLLGGRKRVLECYSYSRGLGWHSFHPIDEFPSAKYYANYAFRLRPEPPPKRLVPWGPEDVKARTQFRCLGGSVRINYYAVRPEGVTFTVTGPVRSFTILREEFEATNDDGVTWARCEKEVEG